MSSAVAATPPSASRAAGRGRQMLGWLTDAVLLLLVVLALPLAILILCAPLVVVVQLLMAIGRRW